MWADLSAISPQKIEYGGITRDAGQVLATLAKIEDEIQTGDGAWYSMNISPYRTLENVIDGVVITFVDITRIKVGESSIRRLATVVMDSNDAITVYDLEGNISAWNKGAKKMYGYSEAEALKMNIRDIVPDDKKAEALDFVRQYERRKRSVVVKYTAKNQRRQGHGCVADGDQTGG